MKLTQSDKVNCAAITGSDEILDPSLAVRCTGRCRAAKAQALALQRLNMLFPHGSTVLRGHVGLSTLVRSEV
jgi:hypothetical protein